MDTICHASSIGPLAMSSSQGRIHKQRQVLSTFHQDYHQHRTPRYLLHTEPFRLEVQLDPYKRCLCLPYDLLLYLIQGQTCSNEMDHLVDIENETQTQQHRIFFRLEGWPHELIFFQYLDQGQRFQERTEQQLAEYHHHYQCHCVHFY